MADKFSDLFDQNRTIWVWMNKAADVLTVALLWTLFSLPVVTAGASSSAAYYVLLKMARKEDGYIWRNFIKAFKRDFAQATVLWLVVSSVGAGICFAMYYYYTQGDAVSMGIEAFLMGMMAVVCIVAVYLPPIVCRFSNRTGVLLRMAFFMPFKKFGWTVVLLAMFLAFIFLAWFIIPFVLVAYGVYAFATSFIFVKIFAPYEDAIRKRDGAQQEDESAGENTPDRDL